MVVPDLSKFKYEKNNNSSEPSTTGSLKRPRRHSEDGQQQVKGQERKQKILRVRVPERPKDWPGPLPPLLQPGLRVVFVGFNPGVESGKQGHYYAHGSNRFWKFLFWSGLTPTLHTTKDDIKMPELYKFGFTDLVARCTKGIQQLSKQEMADGVDLLDKRIAEVKPKAVCLVGKGIWETIAKTRKWDLKKFRYGHDPEHNFGEGSSELYCVPSTSGLNSISAEKQLKSWAELKESLK